MPLKIVRKPKVNDSESTNCKLVNNAEYAWSAQWSRDDYKNIPRKVRGTDKDRRIK